MKYKALTRDVEAVRVSDIISCILDGDINGWLPDWVCNMYEKQELFIDYADDDSPDAILIIVNGCDRLVCKDDVLVKDSTGVIFPVAGYAFDACYEYAEDEE